MSKGNTSKRSARGAPPEARLQVYTSHSAQSSRLQFVLPSKKEFSLKVDAVWHWQKQLLISGWTSSPCTLRLQIGDTIYTPEAFSIHRDDIDDATPFALLLPLQLEMDISQIRLCIVATHLDFQQAFPLIPDKSDDWEQKAFTLTPVLASIAGTQELFSPEWHITRSLLPESPLPCPDAVGVLDYALHTAWTHAAIIAGWLTAMPGTQLWLEHDSGQVWPLDAAWRYYRKDVDEAVGDTFNSECNRAFITTIDNVSLTGRLHIKAISGGETPSRHTVCSISIENCGYDIRKLAEKSFLPTIPIGDFAVPAALHLEPVISDCLAAQANAQRDLPVLHKTLGTQPKNPLVSIIIPLYGRYDFVDYQLAGFRADSWLLEHCEIIYVLDDPEIVAGFSAKAPHIHQLYGVPFQWLWGQTNRGFSGANNLGTAKARAEILLFLNSDVFPCAPGWARQLYDGTNASVMTGAVGARLLRVDGSLQHAGIRFRYAGELGVWINDHPYAGCSPTLDPHKQAVAMPAVTGACLAIRKQHLAAVGGWDSNYLIGDFEDSDLCMQLRAQGLQILYEPKACLTHLERQSYCLWGDGDFRQRVTLSNAVRQGKKWDSQISQLQGGQA